MDDDIRMTGTFQMLRVKDGPSIVEARAWKLAKADKNPDWRSYIEVAKLQLLEEAGITLDPQ